MMRHVKFILQTLGGSISPEHAPPPSSLLTSLEETIIIRLLPFLSRSVSSGGE